MDDIETIMANAEELHEDMDSDSLLLAPGDPAQQLFSRKRPKLKVLNFIKEPQLAEPIMKLVKLKTFKATLGHGKETNFLQYVVEKFFRTGKVLHGYNPTNDFGAK